MADFFIVGNDHRGFLSPLNFGADCDSLHFFCGLVFSYEIENSKDKVSRILIILTLLMLPLLIYWQPLFTVRPFLWTEILNYPRSPFGQINLAESVMLILAVFISLVSLWYFPKKTRSKTAIIFSSIIVWSLFTTLNPFLNHRTGFQGITGRLDILAYLQAAIAVPLSIKLLPIGFRIFTSITAITFGGLLCWSYLIPIPAGK